MDYRYVHSECFLKRQFWGAHPLALDALTEMDFFFFKYLFVFHRRKNGMALGWINYERIFILGWSIPLRYGITLKRANDTSMTPSASFQVNRSLTYLCSLVFSEKWSNEARVNGALFITEEKAGNSSISLTALIALLRVIGQWVMSE